jgi:hypothetical protein
MPVILATWEAEIRRITFAGQPIKKVCKTPSQCKKLGVVTCTCHSSNCRKLKIGRSQFKLVWEESKTLSTK